MPPRPRPERRLVTAGPYLARLAGAGAMLTELEAVLAAWDPERSRADLRELVLDRNLLAKTTWENRVQAWRKLSRRYGMDLQEPTFRAFLTAWKQETARDQRALLAHLLLATGDLLFRMTTLEWLCPRLSPPGAELSAAELSSWLHTQETAHPELLGWSSITRQRWIGHYLGAIRDFGFARGSVTKRATMPHVGPMPAAFAAHLGQMEGLLPQQVLTSQWFGLLGLGLDAAVESLLALNASGAARLRVQGDVVELTLPVFGEGGR